MGKLVQNIKYLKDHNFETTQVINIKLVSLKKDFKKERSMQVYIKSDTVIATIDFRNHLIWTTYIYI